MEAGLLIGAQALTFPDYPDIEKAYVSHLSSSTQSKAPETLKTGSLAQEIQKAREHIKTSLDRVAVSRPFDVGRLDELEKLVTSLVSRISDLESRISTMKLSNDPHDVVGEKSDSEPDLFGSDSEEDKEAERIRSEREAEYLAKKALKPVVAAKSSITLDVKPWDDEVDMEELTSLVKGIKVDGLLWGASKLVPIAFGIKKLQICCVVEDDKVGTDFLEESIKEFSKHVQSVDIVSFNKL
ncbi:elongation factor 1-delta [Schistosoma bovis]|uniref:Elongation factor 1-delta n=1 Tax=Schistosoma bovis TaxID=6184 RepID=A0A430Q7S3_SCHBO|nr:elongation factor 1-delta [Schistosoma bovis]